MQSPRAEWTLGIGYLAAIDMLRARGDADGDTASECLRSAVARIPGGEAVFTVALVAGAWWFRGHILNPLRQEH